MSTGVQLNCILKLSRAKNMPEILMAIELEVTRVISGIVEYLIAVISQQR
jgi:hypothetical protein